MIAKICCTSSGARPSEGSSSSSRRGCAISARPIASICCSPPESVPAFWPRRSRSLGKSVSARSYALGSPRAAQVGAHLEILADGQVGEDPPPLRHLRDPARHAAIRALRRDVRALEPDPAGARLEQTAHGAQERRLPRAVRADQRDDLARLHLEVDRAQREDRAVGDRERLDAQQRGLGAFMRAPLRRRRCPGTPRSRAGRGAPPRGSPPRSSRRGRARSPARTGSSRTECRDRSARC